MGERGGRERGHIPGRGGEQGDPLMPLLFTLGQHRALVAVNAGLQEGERLMAFLDEVHVSTPPVRTGDAHAAAGKHMPPRQASVCTTGRPRSGIPKVRNHVLMFWKDARQLQPEAVVWRGNPELPVSKQGLRVVPVGHPSYILAQLEQNADEHKEFLRRIPVIQDVQSVLRELIIG